GRPRRRSAPRCGRRSPASRGERSVTVWVPASLAGLALVLAGPAPVLLARWHALRRTPRAAMTLWQSVALAAVLAALGSGASLVTLLVLGDREPTWWGWALAGASALV